MPGSSRPALHGNQVGQRWVGGKGLELGLGMTEASGKAGRSLRRSKGTGRSGRATGRSKETGGEGTSRGEWEGGGIYGWY